MMNREAMDNVVYLSEHGIPVGNIPNLTGIALDTARRLIKLANAGRNKDVAEFNRLCAMGNYTKNMEDWAREKYGIEPYASSKNSFNKTGEVSGVDPEAVEMIRDYLSTMNRLLAMNLTDINKKLDRIIEIWEDDKDKIVDTWNKNIGTQEVEDND